MRVIGNFTRDYHLVLPLTCPALPEVDYLELFRRVNLPTPPGGPNDWCMLINLTFPWKTLDLLSGPTCSNGDYAESEISYRFAEGGQLYCFDEPGTEVLRMSRINPYSGRPLPEQVVKDLHITTPLPPIEKDCTQCPNAPDPCQVKKKLSSAAEQWLLEWLKAGRFPGQRLGKIPIALCMEFTKYRRCQTVHLFRGLGFNSNQEARKVLAALGTGHSSLSLSSWSYSRRIAENYAQPEAKKQAGLLLEVEVAPSEIFLDATLLPLQFYTQNTIPQQQEVILLPGTYPVTIVKEWWISSGSAVALSTAPVRVEK
jgi:hypothetical protein